MTLAIIHGIGGHAGIHWQQWLKDKLEASGNTVLMPEMPNTDHPDRSAWLRTIKNVLADVEHDKLILVSHSLGVTTALDYVEQLEDNIYGFVSVAGFSSAYGAELNDYFLKEKIVNYRKVLPKIRSSIVIYGDNDPYVTQAALNEVATELQVTPTIIRQGGHLNSETGYTHFEALLELINNTLLSK